MRRFHTVTTGGGRGKPLMLFLHGFPELWYSWRRQLEEFSDDYEVLLILSFLGWKFTRILYLKLTPFP